MNELLVSAVIGAITGAFASFVLMYYLYDKNFKRERRRELLEKRIEKLYSPLYCNIKSIDALLGKPTISYTKRSKEEGEARMKTYLDQLIEQNFHLASKELQPLLAGIYGVGFYHLKDEDAKKIIELIKKEYNELQDEYFSYT